jgi:hypothetical protein
VKLEFQPGAYGDKVSVDTVVGVQKLKDLRGTDPLLLAHKGVQFKTTGTYVAERELAEIVTDAVKATLASLNYKVDGQQGELTLSGEILKFDSSVMMGFWSGEVDCSIQLNLKLTDNQTGNPLWTEILPGYSKKGHVQIDHEGHRKLVIEAALQDVMKKLAESATFRLAVQNYKSR